MSEYQYLAFRAIDAPVSDKNLEYMRQQSSRAEITEWAFDNEYHYGDFGGDALGMMRRGYDIHIHYANFGIRDLMIRLPAGWPDARAAKPYLNVEGITFEKDPKGPGGVLQITPYYESEEIVELWEIETWIGKLAPLRAEILEGDLRPLYLLHLAVSSDDNRDPEETKEAPVPAGLDQLTAAQRELATFYAIPESLLQAAAQGAPALTRTAGPKNQLEKWLLAQPVAKKDEWLSHLLSNPLPTRSEIVTAYRAACPVAAWPTTPASRTIGELHSAAKELEMEKAKESGAKGGKKPRKP